MYHYLVLSLLKSVFTKVTYFALGVAFTLYFPDKVNHLIVQIQQAYTQLLPALS